MIQRKLGNPRIRAKWKVEECKNRITKTTRWARRKFEMWEMSTIKLHGIIPKFFIWFLIRRCRDISIFYKNMDLMQKRNAKTKRRSKKYRERNNSQYMFKRDRDLQMEYNVCRPVRALEWARLASLVTPTIYPKLILFIISCALFLYLSKGIGCLVIALAICFKICVSDPPWLIILLKRPIADGKKSEYRRVHRDIRRNSDMTDP